MGLEEICRYGEIEKRMNYLTISSIILSSFYFDRDIEQNVTSTSSILCDLICKKLQHFYFSPQMRKFEEMLHIWNDRGKKLLFNHISYYLLPLL